jgi:hypothetical protein
MNRSEYKLMVESWDKFLNESAVDISGISKIKSLVNRIVLLKKETGKDIKVKVAMNGNVLEVSLENYSVMSLNKIMFCKAWVSNLGLVDSNVRVEGNRVPYVIKYSEVSGGFGPLLYEIGLEVISCYLEKGALMSDRVEVSPPAERVWDRYLTRSKSEFNIQAVKMDFSDETWEDVIYDEPFSWMSDSEQEELKKTKKLTPNDTSDDIYQFSAVINGAKKGDFAGDEWKNIESSLSYAFYKKSPEIINYMLTADRVDSEFDNFEGFNNVDIERSSIIDISI